MLTYYKLPKKIISTLRRWVTPPQFPHEEDDRIARIFFILLCSLPPAFLIFITTRIVTGDVTNIIILSANFPIFFISLYTLRKLHLHRAIFLQVTAGLATVTLICTTGQGIHDIIIISFPVIVILASLLLNKKYLILFSALTFLSLSWIILGEHFGLYQSNPPDRGIPNDLIITGIILTLGSLLTYLITRNYQNSLARIRDEIRQRKIISKQLQENIEDKRQLLRNVHHRINDNLAVISSLVNLELQQMNHNNRAGDALRAIRDRIQAMALVHEQLYRLDSSRTILMDTYVGIMVKKIIATSRHTHPIEYQITIEKIRLDVDKAITCGLIITEIVSETIQQSARHDTRCRIEIFMQLPDSRTCLLKVRSSCIQCDRDKKNPESLRGITLIDVLTNQIEGTLDISTDEGDTVFSIEFPLTIKG